MLRRIIVILLVIVLTASICSCLFAKDERNAKTKPVEVKTTFNPAATRVAVLPVMNAAPEKKYVKGEIDQSLVTARSLIEKAFRERGFIVIPDKKISSDSPRLDSTAGNGVELSKKLNANVVVDCSIKELYTFVSGSFVQRLAGVAVINMKIFNIKNGYLINDDFLDRRDSAPGMLGWSTKNSQMREKALGAVVSLALDGLLKPYAVSSKTASVEQDELEAEADETSSDEQPVKSADQVEKMTEAPVAVKVEEPVSTPASPQPQVTNGPKYLMVNGYSLVPLRAIAEWLGVSLDFDKESKIIVLKTESSTVSLKLNADVASINGKLVQLQSPAIEQAGTTYVPPRFICEAFGARAKFDGVTGEIRIENSSTNAVLILLKS